MRVRIAGKRAAYPVSGTKVFLIAEPTGGLTIQITIKITTIMMPPRTFTSLSIVLFAFFDKKTKMAIAADRM